MWLSFCIDLFVVLCGEFVVEQVFVFVCVYLLQFVLIYVMVMLDEVKVVQQVFGVDVVGYFVESMFVVIVCGLCEFGVCKFVVVGGEMFGVVVQVFDVKLLQIGVQIDLGVLVMVIVDVQLFGFVLKFGNFGMIDFFDKVLCVLDGVV